MKKNEWRNKLLKAVEEKVKGDHTGHSITHLLRTEKYALQIARGEKGKLDEEVISAACLIHDVGRMDEFLGIGHIETGIKFAEEWLPLVGFPEEKIPKVIEAIKLHEQREGDTDKTKAQYKESLIVQDADKLEFVGAVGIARGFQFAGAHKIPVYDPEYKEVDYSYKPLEKVLSELHHIKKLMIEKRFNTKTGEKLAKKRVTFVKKFIDQFIKEWEGKL
ncbi:HD domain protein [uncultured archaeon]|nr:HD domain protein [uncultured archaeon]